MNSERFPGKVLAPLNGRPLIDHVVERVGAAMPLGQIVIATSVERSDDPLAWYAEKSGLAVFRGPLDNVLLRFQLCLERYPSTWIFRVSADSPVLDSTLFSKMLAHRDRRDVDIVTNTFPRTYPKGHSLEMIYGPTFAALKVEDFSAAEQEHVTLAYYEHPERFRILNIESGNASAAREAFVVDTLEDLRRLAAGARGGSTVMGGTAAHERSS